MEKQLTDNQIPFYNPEIWGGIECTINRVEDQFFDQLDYSGHYERESDIDAMAGLGVKKLRYPLLWERHQPRRNMTIDWSWAENRLHKIRSHQIDVIAGLVHHGSGPAFTSLHDRHFPKYLAEYAKQVAEKFPWIEYYTPVNEPLTTARFSGLYGLWYPHHRNTRSFMKMLLHELKGTVLAMQEIRKINPAAKLVQTEDLGKTYSTRKLAYQARFENERRWLTFDILCGRFTPEHPLWEYFRGFQIPKEDFTFFLENPCPPDIFGFNHYLTSERFLDHRIEQYPDHTHGGNGRHRYADVEAVRVETEEETGLQVLLTEAWERYKKPIAITEVHLHCTREEQLRWFRQVWNTCRELKTDGMDLRGVTSWALLGSYGWNRLLTAPKGDYEPGAFDLRSGHPRPTALARFIKESTQNAEWDHPLSQENGWWKRSTRLIYEASDTRIHAVPATTAPLLIIGKNGTLGKAFAIACGDRCLNYRLVSREDCDISQPASIEKIISQVKPWAVINAAGFVRVDDAENEAAACMRDNSTGAVNLARVCSRHGIPLVSFSSDLVFDGIKNTPYVESDLPNPLNVYGRSKLQAERDVLKEYPSSLVIRTSAFFGPWDEYNFVHHIRRSLSQYEPVQVPHDIQISPTYVPHLVHAALDILIDEEKGIWHLANQGSLSWYELATEVAGLFQLDRKLIKPVNASQMGYLAARPAYSVLGSERGHLLPSLHSALSEYQQLKNAVKKKVA